MYKLLVFIKQRNSTITSRQQFPTTISVLFSGQPCVRSLRFPTTLPFYSTVPEHQPLLMFICYLGALRAEPATVPFSFSTSCSLEASLPRVAANSRAQKTARDSPDFVMSRSIKHQSKPAKISPKYCMGPSQGSRGYPDLDSHKLFMLSFFIAFGGVRFDV